MKYCSGCKTDKQEDDFNWKIKDKRRQSFCISCNTQYQKDWYQKNKEKHIRNVGKARPARRKRGYDFINKFKTEPCMDCGVSYPPYVMDFDHLQDKSFNVSSGTERSKQSLLDEINKCELVCANCHRIRTYNRLNMPQ